MKTNINTAPAEESLLILVSDICKSTEKIEEMVAIIDEKLFGVGNNKEGKMVDVGSIEGALLITKEKLEKITHKLAIDIDRIG